MAKRNSTKSAGGDDARVVLDSIRRVVRALRVSSRSAEKQLGLSAAQLFVLQKLGDQAGLSVNELADRTFTHQSSVSVVVQRLVDRGLVERNRAANDLRRLELALTAAGKAALRRAPQAAQDKILDGLGRMSGAARKQLARLLEQMVDAAGLGPEPAELLEA